MNGLQIGHQRQRAQGGASNDMGDDALQGLEDPLQDELQHQEFGQQAPQGGEQEDREDDGGDEGDGGGPGLGGLDLQGFQLGGAGGMGATGREAREVSENIERSRGVFQGEASLNEEGTRDRRVRQRQNRRLKKQMRKERKEAKPHIAPTSEDTDALGSGPMDWNQVANIQNKWADWKNYKADQKQQYKSQKKRSHNDQRQRNNRALKKSLKGTHKHWREDYELQKEWFDNDKTTAFTKKRVKKQRDNRLRKAKNARLKARMKETLPSEGSLLEKRKIRNARQNAYEAQKELSPGAQKELRKSQEAKDAERQEKQRKRDNKQLRKSIKRDRRRLGGSQKDGEQVYKRHKQYTKGDQKARDKKADKKARARLVATYNDQLLEELKAEHGDDGKTIKTQFLQRRMYAKDDQRRKGNAKLKKRVSSSEYKATKSHKIDRSDPYKVDKNADTVIAIVGGVNTGASTGNSGISSIFKQVGNDADSSLVNGDSTTLGNGFKMKSGGTTNQAAGILSAVGSALSAAKSAKGLVDAVGRRNSSDPVAREAAKKEIVKSITSLGLNLAGTAKGIMSAWKAFQPEGSEDATKMAFKHIPGLDIGMASIKLIENAAEIITSSVRIGKGGKLLKQAKKDDDVVMKSALKNIQGAEVELVVSNSFDALGQTTKIIQSALMISGVGAPVAAGLKTANTAMSAAKMVAGPILEAIRAKLGKQAHKKYNKAKDGGDTRKLAKHGKNVLKNDTKYAVQGIINKARDGDGQALKYLDLFDVGTKDLHQTTDKELRSLIIGRIGANEDPQTLVEQITGIPGMIKGGYDTIRRKGNGLNG